MSRKPRREIVDPTEIQVFHVLNRTVRRCWLFGDDPLTGINYDHRKGWIEGRLRHFAAQFGIDLLSYAILSNHYHLMLRSRPDVVSTWDDTEVAQRWLMICPIRKENDGTPCQPSKQELDAIRDSPQALAETRLRLSDISWWMRLLDQRIARQSNDEDGAKGRFFEDRFTSIPLIDEQAITACAVYIDLNLIRACMAETVELSEHTSGQLRARALQSQATKAGSGASESSVDQRLTSKSEEVDSDDAFLAPIAVANGSSSPGVMPSRTGRRCSDKGFLEMSERAYLELLDWTARESVAGKRGRTCEDQPPVLNRLGIPGPIWLKLVADFGSLFPTMAGLPHHVELVRSLKSGLRYRLPTKAKELLGQCA